MPSSLPGTNATVTKVLEARIGVDRDQAVLPLWVNSRRWRKRRVMSGSERKADLKSVASEIQFANVCLRAESGPRSVRRLMSANSQQRTLDPIVPLS